MESHEALRVLLELGADVHQFRSIDPVFGIRVWEGGDRERLAPEGSSEWNPLSFAISFSRNLADPEGSALCLATSKEYALRDPDRLASKLRICELLLAAGADPRQKNRMGMSALDEAKRGGYQEITRLLLHGPTPKEPTRNRSWVSRLFRK